VDSTTRFDPDRGLFRLPGIAGAALRAGDGPPGDVRGNGDCVLLDFSRGFFALSDASDRNPAASRNLLQGLNRMFDAPDPWWREGRPPSAADRAGIQKNIVVGAEQLLAGLPATVSCTLTAAKLFRTGRRWEALLLHTGDSAMYADHGRGTPLARLTTGNFWMVGRTRHLYQMQWLTWRCGSRLILATDGIGDLAGAAAAPGGGRLRDLIDAARVDMLPAMIVTAANRPIGQYDDVAVIALSPGDLMPSDLRVVMGGTTAAEEHLRRAAMDGRNPHEWKPPST